MSLATRVQLQNFVESPPVKAQKAEIHKCRNLLMYGVEAALRDSGQSNADISVALLAIFFHKTKNMPVPSRSARKRFCGAIRRAQRKLNAEIEVLCVSRVRTSSIHIKYLMDKSFALSMHECSWSAFVWKPFKIFQSECNLRSFVGW